MHFYLTMCSLLSHWQLEGRAGVRPLPRHPERGFSCMPFQAYFVLTPKIKLSLFQMSGLPISTFRSWRDSCVTVYFSRFLQRNPTILWSRDVTAESHSGHVGAIWPDHIAQPDKITTFSEFYVPGGIWLPHCFHTRYFICTTQSQKEQLFLSSASCLVWLIRCLHAELISGNSFQRTHDAK